MQGGEAMIDAATRRRYQATIGIECHVQFKTRTKLFSAADNDAKEAAPNTLINHIDFGLPGALPVLNEKAIEFGVRAALALGTTPQRFSKFDRKHYFYPDLPLGYQITQFYDPIITGGTVEFTVDGQQHIVRIHEAHLEADAGKSTHPAGADYSLVDLNRAGTPLLEIVSEPDMHSAVEAKTYARELWLKMRYAEVSEANLYYGNMRFDVNVSVSTSDTLGTRTETKNLNSFRSVERAVEYEIERQIAVLEGGERVVQETRGWDDSGQKTFSQRSKEDAYEYRYMPDPDIPPVVITDEYVERIAADMPELPDAYRATFVSLGLDAKTVEDIIAEPTIARQVGRIHAESPEHARRVAFWLMRGQSDTTADDGDAEDDAATPADDTGSEVNEVKPTDTKEPSQVEIADEKLITLSQMVADDRLSSTAAKEVLDAMYTSDAGPEAIAESKNLVQVSDEGAIQKIVGAVISANPKAAADVQAGEMKAIGFLVGQVMKESQGKANPALATKLIKQQLGL